MADILKKSVVKIGKQNFSARKKILRIAIRRVQSGEFTLIRKFFTGSPAQRGGRCSEFARAPSTKASMLIGRKCGPRRARGRNHIAFSKFRFWDDLNEVLRGAMPEKRGLFSNLLSGFSKKTGY